MPQDYSGKSVVVTGSNSGIGEAIAVMFAERGAMVTLCGRNEARLEAALEKCRNASGGQVDRFITVAGDVCKAEIRKEILNKTVEKFGRLDILVPNAGVDALNEGMDIKEKDYDDIMDTNVKSVLFLIQEAVPHLEKSQGNVVCVSSINSTVPYANEIVYCISKAALDHMVRCLALCLGPKGIRVNAINPTLVPNTSINRFLGASEASFITALDARFGSKHPLHGRSSTVEEQAEAVLFMADNTCATFISGQCLCVDGAITLGMRE